MKSAQNGPAILNISLDMLSSPVALPVDNEHMSVLISVVVMGASLSKEVWVGVGGLSLKYWEHENFDSGGLSSGGFFVVQVFEEGG